MGNQSIEKLLIALNKAQQNLQNIRQEFSGDSVLLQVYGASAEEAVRIYQKRLEVTLAAQTHMNVSVSDDSDVDFWIHIEGNDFRDGSGPIAFIGNYLNKLNTACRDTIRLFGNNIPIGREDSLFYLSGVAAGSLKIGIKKNSSLDMQIKEEASLFEEEENWENVRHLAQKSGSIENAVAKLLKTMECANSENCLGEIRDEIGDDDKFLKLLTYVRELAPSNKSGISSISFETSNKDVRISQETRTFIRDYTKKMLPEKQYVSGIAAIRSQDMDFKRMIARPFRYENETINELECILPDGIDGGVYLDQIIGLTGFLVKIRNNNHLKLEVDSINTQSQED